MRPADLYPHAEKIGVAYWRLLAADLPAAGSAEVAAAWRELAEDAEDRAAGIRLLLDVRETADAEPYPDALAMVRDIGRGRFLVSTSNCEHPLWSVSQNVDFRIVHDVLGHYAASIAAMRPGVPIPGGTWAARAQVPDLLWDSSTVAGFDWEGECAACCAHAPLVPSIAARKALFVECLAQTAYACTRGHFASQAVGFIGPYLGGDIDAADPVPSLYAAFTQER